MRISVSQIADALESGMRREFERCDLEQSVYGLDIAEELKLHPFLAAALKEAGYGVFREQHYPADRTSRRMTLSEGERCDFVLTSDGRELRRPEACGTLFDAMAADDCVALDDAFWLEVKVVSQFTTEGPNANYSSQLLSCVRQDVSKLSKEPGILHAALLIVLFVSDERVADHDLKIWQDKCLERSLPIAAPSIRRVRITNRHGHGLCVMAIYPVSHL